MRSAREFETLEPELHATVGDGWKEWEVVSSGAFLLTREGEKRSSGNIKVLSEETES
jgi:hypothetical protein